MKNATNLFFNHLAKWRRVGIHAAGVMLLVVCGLWLLPTEAQANDFLELEKNYTAYAAGVDKVHFKLPIYSRGARDYYVSTNSQGESCVYYKIGSTEYKIFSYGSEHNSDGPSANDKKAYGRAYVKAYSGKGVVEITNIHDGQRKLVPSDNVERTYDVVKTKEPDNDNDNVTWLEIDWYPQEELDGQTFNVGTHVKISLRMTGNVNYQKDWTLATGLQGSDNLIQAQLYDPYFYTVNDAGVTGYGNAAIPYMLFYDPKSYHTSLDTTEYNTGDRANTLYVPTTDTVQEQFYATFQVYRMKQPAEVMTTQQTTKVDIPPYHRIYDFEAVEEQDSTGTYTGRNVLHWQVKNPRLADLVEGDYFEIQRALQPDFSDAKQLGVEAMMRDTGYYSFPDDSRETWTGVAASEMDTIDTRLKVTDSHFVLTDDDGAPLYELEATLTSQKVVVSSVPVYYRIRRATSSVWGWVDGFSREVRMDKHNYLAPLAETLPDYTKDADYDKNHEVHFRIPITNAEVQPQPLSKDECRLNYTITDMATTDMATVTLYYQGGIPGLVKTPDEVTQFCVLAADGRTLSDWQRWTAGEHIVPVGGKVQLKVTDPNYPTDIRQTFQEYSIWGDAIMSCETYRLGVTPRLQVLFNGASAPDLSAYEPMIKDSLYKRLEAMAESDLGRCMWDRTARLILMRTLEETGQTLEFIIPQDSIRRLEDGSWMASYTDVASQACSHYRYAVRIDQSKSDLHVQDSAQLQPRTINGPELYYDEAAVITLFSTSQGNAVGQRKLGVTLNWIPSSNAVDEFVVTRVRENSDQSADTIYRGLDNSYFDRTAEPNVRYEYTVTSFYYCNGRASEHSATAIGSRSPYGEISGSILMPDNSGLAGVEVALQSPDGTVIRRMTTDATGAYLFDSLTYDIHSGSDYAVIPTHPHAVFSFNNTTAQSASVGLSADNAVVRDICFVNTSAARLTGRVLYKNTTIPVAGAMFTLNSDTICRNRVPVQTGTDGNFELTLTTAQPYCLRIVKEGHTFEGDGILHVTQGTDTFALTQPLDGVRFYDETKVRLVGRVAGGIDQRDLPEAFGLGTNNLGEDLQLVLQLEGDNVAQIVHDPNDLTRDTVIQEVAGTYSIFEKKRIVIRPDQATGEYQIDLFPVKYKVTQATARGYATLFAPGQGSEVVDLTNAPLHVTTAYHDGDSATYHAVYDRIYRSPVKVQLKQLMYGLEQDGYGEPSISASGFDPNNKTKVPLYTRHSDGTVTYIMGYPIFYYNRRYQFEAEAYEEYYFNNNPTDTVDRVPQRGGKVTIHNGMHSSTDHQTYDLDILGKNSNIWLLVDHIQTQTYGEDALSTVSIALEQEGNTVETDAFHAYVIGDVIQGNELTANEANITLLDIIRDPGGAGSSAWVENGTTYTYGYTESYDLKAGINLTPKYGLSVTNDIGTVTAPQGAGSYVGSTFQSSKQLSFTLPITHEWSWGYKYTYSVTTSEKISTSSAKNKSGIGSNADIFLGVTTSQLTGKAKSIDIIDDTLFQARQPAIAAGTMHVLASGVDSLNKPYYLVTGEKVVMGSAVTHTFAWSQYYIMENVLPQLALQRQNLLMTFPDSAAAQAAADASGDVVYWFIDSLTSVSLQDTLLKDSYKMVLPQNSKNAYPDRVAAIDNIIQEWCTILIQNEEEKVKARQSGDHVGTYSVNAGATFTHSDSYSATAGYNEMPQGAWLFATDAGTAVGKNAANLMSQAIKNFSDFFGKKKNYARFGTSLKDALHSLTTDTKADKTEQRKRRRHLGTVTNTSRWDMDFEPVLDFDSDARTSNEKTVKKTCGFTLVPDAQGDITVSVYRAELDSLWKDTTKTIRNNTGVPDDNEVLYGSYVFFTQAGTSYCMPEKEERTEYYNPGTVINNSTMTLAVPEMSIDRHEISSVPSDQRARFHVVLKNEGQVQYGLPEAGMSFTLSFLGESNPHGAKVYINGAPLNQGLSYFLAPGQAVTQVMEVERGEVDDYEDLTLFFSPSDCPKNNAMLNFSVHFMPESSPVSIDMPRQNWVMNTLSPLDSAGYYLPVNIGGFNVHHKNFDHIEFQYKLASESDERWVNAMSFYADDSLYNLATGNKTMIENGRITPFRFYGERDPMEQRYDLRAVSFCRYGSGFVTKESQVISGTKDTRNPRVFGEPEPADAILGIGDHLLLRFNEALAGNYLDEDNNFQILGVTNQTGITAGTALHFDLGTTAVTKVKRDLTDKSFTLDMMLRPSDANRTDDQVLFMFGNDDAMRMFVLTADNRLQVRSVVGSTLLVSTSKQIGPILAFTRVLFVYDKDLQQYRFYAGTTDLTDVLLGETDAALPTGSAELRFGGNYKGDMLEVRLWTKALTLEEIAATADHYLTGYEQELLAYYRMNEGKGETIVDRAHGATLYLKGCSWNKQKGYSVHLAQTDRVQLNGNLFGRSRAYDATYMFWFKTATASAERANLFAAGRTDDNHGALIALENGHIVLCSDSLTWTGATNYADGEWHHVVLSVNRTYNNAAFFVDGNLIQTFAATLAAAMQGAMYLGGNFNGYIDEFAVFEQAMPKTLVEAYDNIALAGDEMGLIAYLPFEEQFINPNGILEQRFSVNDRRQYRDPQTGEVINKIVPLVQGDVTALADNTMNAPVSSHGLLTKLNFDWSFNGDELMINLNMLDREINKQSVYVTVRDVEDLNGNPMLSPVTWVAFVDRNTLKWEDDDLDIYHEYGTSDNGGNYVDFQIINHSGKRHTYKIESLPDWLTIKQSYGTINPQEDKTIRFYYDTEQPVGDYLDLVYLTDEDGLSEPLEVEYHVNSLPPYDGVDATRYPLNMSVCGQVKIDNSFDSDENDIIYALFRNACVGMTNVDFDDERNTARVFLTVYGSEAMNGKTVNFVLWQASTGKVLNLVPGREIQFAHGAVYGCGDDQPVIFTAGGSETQNILLPGGWTWISTYLNLRPANAPLNSVMTASDPWREGDLIKNPDMEQFCTYSQVMDVFMGSLAAWDYSQIYMVYSANSNTLRLNGDKLPDADKHLTLIGNGHWNPFPCLFMQSTPVEEALADYYNHATPGDLIKSHDHFAVFSADGHWEGNLTALRPGEGYLFRRLAADTVDIHFYTKPANSPSRVEGAPARGREYETAFHSKAATNMTMICTLSGEAGLSSVSPKDGLYVFIGDELVGVATKIDSLYFLTISSNVPGTIRFTTADGILLTPFPSGEGRGEAFPPFPSGEGRGEAYEANAHLGTPESPVLLTPVDDRPYKILENNHIVIIKNNEKYDVTGKKLH